MRLPTPPFSAAVIAVALIAIPAALAIAAPQAVMVTIKNFDFSPMSITVPVGGSVTWKNLDGEPHTVTSTDGLFRSGGLDQGDSFTYRFARAGTYTYVCSIHPQMKASVIVK